METHYQRVSQWVQILVASFLGSGINGNTTQFLAQAHFRASLPFQEVELMETRYNSSRLQYWWSLPFQEVELMETPSQIGACFQKWKSLPFQEVELMETGASSILSMIISKSLPFQEVELMETGSVGDIESLPFFESLPFQEVELMETRYFSQYQEQN